jgi:hypothetical protein
MRLSNEVGWRIKASTLCSLATKLPQDDEQSFHISWGCHVASLVSFHTGGELLVRSCGVRPGRDWQSCRLAVACARKSSNERTWRSDGRGHATWGFLRLSQIFRRPIIRHALAAVP